MAGPLVTAVRLFRLRKRLRLLQCRYYGAVGREDAVITEYYGTLERARELAAPRSRGRRLHLGCEAHRIKGWVNVDIARSPAVDVQTDLARPFPFRNDSIDLIHSEEFVEHLSVENGRRLFAECYRVLRPGGSMRLLTPDLRLLVQQVYLGARENHLSFCGAQLGAGTPCEAFNMWCRMNGEHRFLYDFPYLKATLASLGFEVRRVRWNRSRSPGLRYLDLRNFGLTLFVEARKPAGA
jgi:predicted SAM-dependent methyltransferase